MLNIMFSRLYFCIDRIIIIRCHHRAQNIKRKSYKHYDLTGLSWLVRISILLTLGQKWHVLKLILKLYA